MSGKKRLVYIPLGGAGEIGMNMYLYGYGRAGKEDFILVDVGVTFPRTESSPGVDLIIADPDFLIRNKERIRAVFITHAHEDHVGAVGHLYNIFDCKIFCRPFTYNIACNKVCSFGYDEKKLKIVESFPEVIELGAFKVSFISISHSIPEASALLIQTPLGKIIHTGDFKMDYSPVIGDPFDDKTLGTIAKDGLLALVCDSTNVFSENPGRSESSIEKKLTKLFKKEKGAVIATTFASNIARLLTLTKCAKKSGRSVLVLGRAMQTMISAACSSGIINGFPTTISTEEAENVPRGNLFILATGSQGEFRAAAAQLSRGSYLGISLYHGDCFLFSSKTIPGNELAVGQVINNLVSRGVKVVDDKTSDYHVSGHANRPDLIKIHALLKPNILIPMHGEARHLYEHYNLAKNSGIKSIIAINGDVVEITEKGVAHINENISVGRVYIEDGNLIGSEETAIKDRIKMAIRGHVSVSLVVEEENILENSVWVKSKGILRRPEEVEVLEDMIENEIEYQISMSDLKVCSDDVKIESLIQIAVNRICKRQISKKPITTIFINRLN